MSQEDGGDVESAKPFYVERAKTGRSACKKCKQKINSGDLRLGKLGYNPFSSGTMKLWHHVPCLFEVFKKQRKTTKKIDRCTDIDGWEVIDANDKDTIKSFLTEEELKVFEEVVVTSAPCSQPKENKDDTFRAFRKICSDLTNASSYLQKTSIVKEFFTRGSDGKKFQGDVQLWCRNLLPMVAKRIYNLQSKQLVKIFSGIFHADQEEMLEHLEQGDIAETIGTFYETSSVTPPAAKAVLTLKEVDLFLEHLSKLTKESDQTDHFSKILKSCTTNDLKVIIRLIKHDLRINAGPKHILEALHPKAYQAFQTSRDLKSVVKDAWQKMGSDTKPSGGIDIKISIMTPVLPMLAEACKSVDMALTKCPNGMYSEIKYDGERVQVHKQGSEFKYFSRSLKPVLPHKVKHFEKYIPMAFPHGKDLILDCEILLVDTKTGQLLPFGTLGAHKKSQFQDASVCLFVFDCIYLNGVQLIDKPIQTRRRILEENMTEITNHVMFSEVKEIHRKEDLEGMMEQVFRQGLEGLVLKSLESYYKPGKRHWLKVKKDYLFGGAMADSADLVVLGAWYGTGKKGGIKSIFLMGCYDASQRKWVTVTKVHGGHDDKTLEELQTKLRMNKISKDPSKVPSWLFCSKSMIPDFVACDPTNSPVWEITGAEFTRNQVHTADGISIRFPRVTKIREDKNWETATSLTELMALYDISKDTSGFTLRRDKTPESKSGDASTTPNKKRKQKDERSPDSAKKSRKKKEAKVEDSGSETEVDEDVKSPSEKLKRHEDKRSNCSKGEKWDKEDSRKVPKAKVEDSGSDTEVDEEAVEATIAVTKSPSEKHKRKNEIKRSDGSKEECSTAKKIKSSLKREKSKLDDSGSDTEVDEELVETVLKKSPSEKHKKRHEDKRNNGSKERLPYSADKVKDRKKETKAKVEDGSDTEVDEELVETVLTKSPSEKHRKRHEDKRSNGSKERLPYSAEKVKDSRKETKAKVEDGSDTEVDEELVETILTKSPSEKHKKRHEDKRSNCSRKDTKAKMEDHGSDTEVDEDLVETTLLDAKSRDKKQKSRDNVNIKNGAVDSEKKFKDRRKEKIGETESDTGVKQKPLEPMRNPLPDVFVDSVIFLHPDVADKRLLQRFIVAYGGSVSDTQDRNSLINNRVTATHVVYPQRIVKKKVSLPENNQNVAHISVDWLWDCIKQRSRRPESTYVINVIR